MASWRTVRAIATRLGERLLVLIAIATILFFMFRLMPGNPLVAYISPTFTEEQQRLLTEQFGLDKPLSAQYFIYMGNLVKGNLGDSFFYKKPVADVMLELLPNTLVLAIIPLVLAYVFGIVAGGLLAWRRGSRLEGAGILYTLVSRSAPEFWVGMILLTIFAFKLQWLPASGATSPGVIYPSFLNQFFSLDYWRHLVLPAMTMAFYLQGLPLLLMRSNMLDVMQEDFVTLARMKGSANGPSCCAMPLAMRCCRWSPRWPWELVMLLEVMWSSRRSSVGRGWDACSCARYRLATIRWLKAPS